MNRPELPREEDLLGMLAHRSYLNFPAAGTPTAPSLTTYGPPPASPTTSPDGNRPRVLLIEDDPLQCRGLLRLLDHHGITAHTVTTAAAGLQAIATQPPYEAIISDLLLPDLPGDELARRLRRPLLISYSGLDRSCSWFDASLTKPALVHLLHLLRAPRLTLVITSDEDGVHAGHCLELGLRCHGRTPLDALRLLLRVLEERYFRDG